MPKVFVSYAREDEARIRPLVSALERQGWEVFWDRRVPAGQSWRMHIGRALAESDCVVVAWSTHGIRSNFVIEEADDGQQRGVLVPLLLDSVSPPLGFRNVHAADLSTWRGDEHAPELHQWLSDVAAMLQLPAPDSAKVEPTDSRRRKERTVLTRAAAGLALGVVLSLALWGISHRLPTGETGAPLAAGASAASVGGVLPTPTPASLAKTPTASVEAPACLEAGPFDVVKTASVVDALKTALPDLRWSVTKSLGGAVWMVYLGRYADKDAQARKADELRRIEVAFEEVSEPAYLAPGLSLGRYDRRETADAALGLLARRGIRTARTVEVTSPVPTQTLRIQPNAANAASLKRLDLGFAACKRG